MMKSFSFSVVVITSLLVVSQSSDGHARFKLNAAFQARSTDTGLKEAPCGGVDVGQKRTILRTGETVTVEWEETINHPGFYRIAFSPDGVTGFDDNILADNIIDNQDMAIVGMNYHSFSTTIVVPEPCETCALQMIQYMTEDPENPRLYYSCADIQIKAADDPSLVLPPPPVLEEIKFTTKDNERD